MAIVKAPAHASTPLAILRRANDNDGGFGHLYQNYFAFAAIVVFVALVGGCIFYRRKKRVVRRATVARQMALSRDVEDQDLRSNRAWGWGALSRDYASGPAPRGQPLGARGTIGLTPWRRRREDEGLNEAGEAPPAYKSAPDDNDTVLETAQPVPAPAVPRPALARENTGLKPPDYTEAVVSSVPATSSNTIPTSTATNTAISLPTTSNADVDVERGDLPSYPAGNHERR